jgi:hypothetical protein
VQNVVHGTFQTWLIWPTMSDIEGEADLSVTKQENDPISGPRLFNAAA